MSKISFSKEQLEGNVYPPGLYDLRLEGFEPAWSKKRDSVNLNPVLKIVNHPTLNNKRVFDNLNSSAGWILEAFCHAFGHAFVPNANGGGDMPGDFPGPEDDPEQWHYVGPLTGCVAKVMLKTTSYNGKDSTKVDQWICALGTACPPSTKHPSNLAR